MDEIVFTEDLAGTLVSIVLAHQPGAPNTQFDEVMINDISIWLGEPISLGVQGLMWNIAHFERGRELRLRWTFSNRSVNGLKYTVGVVFNGRLTAFAKLKDYIVEPYTQYRDEALVKIPLS